MLFTVDFGLRQVEIVVARVDGDIEDPVRITRSAHKYYPMHRLDVNTMHSRQAYVMKCATPIGDEWAVRRGTWARVTIGEFRRSARRTAGA